MQLIQQQHIPRYLQVLQTVEFLAEYFGKPTEKRLYQYFFALEFLKICVKLRKWQLVDKFGLMISESNTYVEIDHKEEEAAEQFQQEWGGLEYDPQATDAKSIKETIKALKQPTVKFNLGYFDVVGDKQVNLLTTLPIPKELRQKDYKSKINSVRIQVGEVIHLLRPLIYCALILYYGSGSYKPYLISLALDILRFLIELQIKLCRKSQKEELKLRAKEAIVNIEYSLDLLYFEKSILHSNSEIKNIKQSFGTVIQDRWMDIQVDNWIDRVKIIKMFVVVIFVFIF